MKRYAAITALGGLALAAHGADAEQAVDELIPKMADEDVPKRYDAQMALQDIASEASTPGNEKARKELGEILAKKAGDTTVPQPARVWIVRQLEYMGRDEAVRALAKVMADKSDQELSECARRALEKNPAEAATRSLRNALEKETDTRMKIGLINSLAERGDARSIKLIVKGLSDPATASAAAVALGHLGTGAAVEALWPQLNKDPVAGDALINAANKIAKENPGDAKKIYERIAKEAKSKSLQTAAKAGLGEKA